MAQVEIKFQERFREAMAEGVKVQTARREKHGEVGDTSRPSGPGFA